MWELTDLGVSGSLVKFFTKSRYTGGRSVARRRDHGQRAAERAEFVRARDPGPAGQCLALGAGGRRQLFADWRDSAAGRGRILAGWPAGYESLDDGRRPAAGDRRRLLRV